jgi:hypothetical protein
MCMVLTRSTPAMVSIATTGSRIGPAFPRYGRKTGLAGNFSFYSFFLSFPLSWNSIIAKK